MASEAPATPQIPLLDPHYFRLYNNSMIPALGFGTYFGDESAPLSQDYVDELIKTAAEVGYRHFDAAFLYQNEGKVGNALTKVMDQGLVNRRDLFITSKLYGTCHEPWVVPQACAKSMKDLGVDTLDLYLIHCPLPFPYPQQGLDTIDPIMDAETGLPVVGTTPLMETWRAMERLYEKEDCLAIGVSNWTIPLLEHMLENCTVKPMVNQIEVHPFLPQSGPDKGWKGRDDWPTTGLVDWCKENNIHVTAYSPLGAGHFGSEDPIVLEDPTIEAIARENGIPPASVCLSWLVKRGLSCVSRTTKLQRVAENFKIYDLKDSDMKRMGEIETRWRYIQTRNGWGIDTAGDDLGLKRKAK